MSIQLKQYKELGYSFLKNLISEQICEELKASLRNLPGKIFIPYTDIPWGYGNLLQESKFNQVLQNQTLQLTLKSILGEKFTFNHLVVNNKESFIGSAVEWHQEASAIDTFAPGYTVEDVDKFVQVYIALDDHIQDNGCLNIFPGSHKEGLLPHDDIIGYNLNHKKQIKHSALVELNDKTPVKPIQMKAGDALIFSHLLVHGSGSNISPISRKAIVLQARIDDREKDLEVYSRAVNFRTNFTIKELSNRIEKLKESNLYKDFK